MTKGQVDFGTEMSGTEVTKADMVYDRLDQGPAWIGGEMSVILTGRFD